jgi:hypothetical protein
MHGLQNGQMLDFWLSFVVVLLLCVKFDLA